MKFTPRPYQHLIRSFTLDHERCSVFASPGMGKTSFALNVGVNACHAQRCAVAVFSLEMPKDQLV